MKTEGDVDIYGEAAEDSGPSKNGQTDGLHDGEDLYDTVLTSGADRRDSTDSVGKRSSMFSVSSGGAVKMGDRRYSLYFGNMTWWTTDQDLMDLINTVGINDVLEIKFYENRTNGQSKGYAVVAFATEASLKTAGERLPNKEIHGQKIVILPYTKQSLAQFESATRRTESSPRADRRSDQGREVKNPAQNFVGTVRIGTEPAGPGVMPPPAHMLPQVIQAPMVSFNGPPPGFPPMPGRPPMLLPAGIPPPGALPPGMPPPLRMLPPGAHVVGPPSIPPPALPAGARPPGPPGIPVGMTRPPPTMPPPIPGAPAPHINPSFYRPPTTGAPPVSTGPPPPVAAGGVPVPGIPAPTIPPQLEQVSEAEFEEIMNRNKTVSSSAISRAVSDASAGDFAAAIETLVTAISLIRQSRVAHDDRCKILVASLQDTLHGIEAKSYGRSEKHRSRDRSRSRDRESRRERKRARERTSRSRSRSRERAYRPHQEMEEYVQRRRY